METSWIRHSSLKAKSQEVFQEPSLWRQVVTETALHGTEPSLIIKKKIGLPLDLYCYHCQKKYTTGVMKFRYLMSLEHLVLEN